MSNCIICGSYISEIYDNAGYDICAECDSDELLEVKQE